MKNKLYKYAILEVIGGVIYCIIEIVSRGYTHWTMVILGGICFILVGMINEIIPWEMPLIFQMLIGGTIITLCEFVTGCIVNLWLGWGIWDYSSQWCNLLGQICPKYSIFWILLSAVAIILDDYLRYWLFNEEKPRYKLL